MKSIKIKIGGVEHELHCYNAALFFFDDERYNHLFVATEEDDGFYVFGQPDVFKHLGESRCVAMHYMPLEEDDIPAMDKHAYKKWEATQQPYDQAEEAPLTEEEVAYYEREFRDERVIDHWDELEGED